MLSCTIARYILYELANGTCNRSETEVDKDSWVYT